MGKAAITVEATGDDFMAGEIPSDFADLCNQVLEVEHPDVTFTEKEDINRLVAGNGFTDVSGDIDYDGVVCSTPDELRARLA